MSDPEIVAELTRTLQIFIELGADNYYRGAVAYVLAAAEDPNCSDEHLGGMLRRAIVDYDEYRPKDES